MNKHQLILNILFFIFIIGCSKEKNEFDLIEDSSNILESNNLLNTNPSVISITSIDKEAYEDGQDPALFKIQLSHPSNKDLLLNFKLTGGATLNKDFQIYYNKLLASSPIIISSGETEAIITVIPIISPEVEVTENLKVNILKGTDYLIDERSSSSSISIFDYGQSLGNKYYVAINGNDNANGSEENPFATVKKGVSVLQAGDTLYIKDGTYYNPGYTNDHGLNGTKNLSNNALAPLKSSGKKGNWIRIMAYPDGNNIRPILKFDGTGGIWIDNNSSYILIEGLEVSGPNKEIKYSWAHDHRWTKENYYNGRGIFSWGPAHHIVIKNCYVHHTPGSGIRFDNSDYLLVENNTISNTSWWSSSGESGLVVAKALSIDTVEEIKILYSGNVVYNNWNLIEFCALVYKDANSTADDYGNCDHFTGGIKDGRGIYATRNNDTYFYGRTRFENNIAFNNGVEGMLYHKSNRGELINNLIYMNGAYPGTNKSSGLAVIEFSDDVIVHNNLAWARKQNDFGFTEWKTVTNLTSTHNVVIGRMMFGSENENTVILWNKSPDLKKLWKNIVDISGFIPDPKNTGIGYPVQNIDNEIRSLNLDFTTISNATLIINKGLNKVAPSSSINQIDRDIDGEIDIGPYEFKES